MWGCGALFKKHTVGLSVRLLWHTLLKG